MRSIIALTFASLFVSSAALAAQPLPWYEAHPAAVKTLKQAIAEEHEFLADHYDVNNKLVKWPHGNPYWHGHNADAKTCAALKSVGLTCDYNTRSTLTDFLTVNDKGLFPAAGGTNPWYTATDRAEEIKSHAKYGTWVGIDNAFIGQPRQNAMLASAVHRNASLFHHGDLTAADVRAKWH